MKVTCKFCGRVYKTEDYNCPGCGAYNQPPEAPPQPPPRQSPPVREPVEVKKKMAPWVPLAVVLAIGLLSIVIMPTGSRTTTSANVVEQVNLDVDALYIEIEQQQENHQLVLTLVQQLYHSGNQEEAATATMLLFSRDVRDPEVLRAAGEIMLEQGDLYLACRTYLAAFVLAGETADLDRAAACGAPVEIITAGPTTQALEFLFGKQMRQITWEEIGRVRYFSLHSDYIDVSLLDPAESDEDAFAGSLVSVKFDSGATVSFTYLYGLRELAVHTGIDTGNLNLFGLRSLRSLTLTSIHGFEDLTMFSAIPHLEELYIGGKDITSLEGLDALPNLSTLSLTGTSIDNLSILATYGNIQRLYLSNNKELTSISSLEYMEHLKTLSVVRQEVLDFQFLQKLYRLEELELVDTGIKDIYFLSRMDTLRSLVLYDNSDLKSIAGIGALQDLTRLDVQCNKMEGVAEIAGLGQLTWLKLRTPNDLNMLSGLANLESLEIYSAGLLDSIQPVAELQNLRSFTISSFSSNHYYFSLEPLTRLNNLTRVSLPDCQFLGTAAPLLGIGSLEYLDLTGAQLEVGPAGFSGLTNIRTLKASGIRPLSNIRVYSDGFFTSVDYDKVEGDLLAATLAGLDNLSRLEYADAGLTDLSFARGLPALGYIDLSENYITEIEALGEAGNLQYADLSGNPVRDWAPSESWPGVRVVRR